MCPHRLESQHSPHHIAAEHGNLSLYKFIAQKTNVVHPERSEDGLTGLHSSARELKSVKYRLDFLKGTIIQYNNVYFRG